MAAPDAKAPGDLPYHPGPKPPGIRPGNGREVRHVTNPRYANGNLRRRMQQRFRAMGAPCAICGGRLGPIRYEDPSDAKHPLSFVIDERRPVSRWREFGYASPAAAAQDPENVQAAHWACNAAKGARVRVPAMQQQHQADGDW